MDYAVVGLLGVVALSIIFMESRKGAISFSPKKKAEPSHVVPVVRGAVVYCPGVPEGARVISAVKNKADPECGTVTLVNKYGEVFSLDVRWDDDFFVEPSMSDSLSFLSNPEDCVKIWCKRNVHGHYENDFGPGSKSWNTLSLVSKDRKHALWMADEAERKMKSLLNDRAKSEELMSKADEIGQVQSLVEVRTNPVRKVSKDEEENTE